MDSLQTPERVPDCCVEDEQTEEERLDPEDEQFGTWSVVLAKYSSRYTAQEIKAYWAESCLAVPKLCGGDVGDNDPCCGTTALRLAECLLKNGRPQQAKEVCGRIVAEDPGHAEALTFLAFLHDLCHETHLTIEWAQRAGVANPSHPRPWLLLGMSLSRLGRFGEAMAAYTTCKDCDPDGNVGCYASTLAGNLQKNLDCALQTRDSWAECAHWIAMQPVREHPVTLNDDTEEFSLRPEFNAAPVLVYDDVLGPDLLQACLESVDDLCSYGLRNPSLMNTFWLARGVRPKTAAEVAGRVLCRSVLGRDPDEFVGFKWWCKNQPASLGAHFHYDCNFQLHRPSYALVLYLASVGGPTVILDQYADQCCHRWPDLPQVGHMVMPRLNRCVIFPGELRHGMVSIDDDQTTRFALLYNFFHTYKVPGPHCQVPDFSRYAPVCDWAPTRQHLLSPDRLERLEEGEAAVNSQRVGPVPLQELSRPEDMEASSHFGDMPCAYPMPNPTRLRDGILNGGAFSLRWRRAAEIFLACL